MIDLPMVLVLVGQMATEGRPDFRPPDARLDATTVQRPVRPSRLPQVVATQPAIPLDEHALPGAREEAARRCPMRILPADPRVDPGMIRTIDPADAARYALRVVPPRCRP